MLGLSESKRQGGNGIREPKPGKRTSSSTSGLFFFLFSSSKNSLGAKFPQIHFASPQKPGSVTAVLIPAGSKAEFWENAFRDSLVPWDGARAVPRYPLCCTPEGQELELSKIPFNQRP